MKEVMYIEPQYAQCQCLTCKCMVPGQVYNEYQYPHLLTDDGKHFVVRTGWCPHEGGSIVFSTARGCGYYEYDPNKEIIIYKGAVGRM